MPAAIKATLDDIIAETGDLEKILPEWEKPAKDFQMPDCFSKVPEEVVKNFPHTKRVGNYLVGKMINKGSFAKVMEGLHIPTGEKVAIKVIDKKKAKQDSYVLKNMKREPRIHQMIKHPNIVQLYETLETENSYYMVVELCLGGDLMDRICDKKKLEEREVRKYIRQITSAVEHLHRHGIVHRDLKIENFLLDENNNIKIVDFGLSNTLKFETLSQELLSTQCGSPAYAAPELLAHKKYGPKVDVWSVGVSMFAMLTGTLPYTVEPFDIKQLQQKMVNGEISPIPHDISSGAVHFMLSLLEADPAKRPSIKEAMEDKWLNEGFFRRPLNAIVYKNRLRPDELNALVLNYMTDNMQFGLSEMINTLINNRPSPITAAYCLLQKKLGRHQKEHKAMKKESTDDKLLNQDEKTAKNPNEEAKLQSTRETCGQTNEEGQNCDNEEPPAPSNLALAEALKEDEIAITLENQDKDFPEGSPYFFFSFKSEMH
ncbi:hormonally up-regulated neu tumor-associated kinase homolog A [Latimeria chalumnae]